MFSIICRPLEVALRCYVWPIFCVAVLCLLSVRVHSEENTVNTIRLYDQDIRVVLPKGLLREPDSPSALVQFRSDIFSTELDAFYIVSFVPTPNSKSNETDDVGFAQYKKQLDKNNFENSLRDAYESNSPKRGGKFVFSAIELVETGIALMMIHHQYREMHVTSLICADGPILLARHIVLLSVCRDAPRVLNGPFLSTFKGQVMTLLNSIK